MAKIKPSLNKADIELLKGVFVTQETFNKYVEYAEEHFVTKEYLDDKLTKLKSDFYEMIEPFLKEIQTSRQERSILTATVSGHDERIAYLEAQLVRSK